MNIKNGKIISIKEVTGVKGDKNSSQDGYEIKTDRHIWLILIDNENWCCEDWGYIVSEDNVDFFIGREVKEVRTTDTGLNTRMINLKEKSEDVCGVQFLDFVFTDGSVLQFAVYNAHNGYYGHKISILKDQEVIIEDNL